MAGLPEMHSYESLDGFGDSLVEGAKRRSRKWYRRPWMRSVALPIALVLVAGSAGVAGAQLADDEPGEPIRPPAEVEVTLNTKEPEFGRNCPDNELSIKIETQPATIAIPKDYAPTCHDGSDPGLSALELAELRQNILEKAP